MSHERYVVPSQYFIPVKTDISEFALKVKLHDERMCSCSHTSSQSRSLARESDDYEDYLYLGQRPSLVKTYDWVVVLFGTRAAVSLSPGQTWPVDQGREDEHSSHENEVRNATVDAQPVAGFDGTFVLNGTLHRHREVDGFSWRPRDEELNAHEYFRCVYGDFEIRKTNLYHRRLSVRNGFSHL